MAVPDLTQENMKLVFWLIILLVGAYSAWRDRALHRDTRYIAKEMSPNSGNSLKDQMTEAVTLCQRAATEAATAREVAVTSLEESKKRQEVIEKDVLGVQTEVKDLTVKFNRYVAHEARNDPLSTTKLAKEAEEYLKKLDEENRRKAAETT
jgi:hypothetical protein